MSLKPPLRVPEDEDDAKQILLGLAAQMPGGATLHTLIFEESTGPFLGPDPWTRVTFRSLAIYMGQLVLQLQDHYEVAQENERELRKYRTMQAHVQEFLGLAGEEEA